MKRAPAGILLIEAIACAAIITIFLGTVVGVAYMAQRAIQQTAIRDRDEDRNQRILNQLRDDIRRGSNISMRERMWRGLTPIAPVVDIWPWLTLEIDGERIVYEVNEVWTHPEPESPPPVPKQTRISKARPNPPPPPIPPAKPARTALVMRTEFRRAVYEGTRLKRWENLNDCSPVKVEVGARQLKWQATEFKCGNGQFEAFLELAEPQFVTVTLKRRTALGEWRLLSAAATTRTRSAGR